MYGNSVRIETVRTRRRERWSALLGLAAALAILCVTLLAVASHADTSRSAAGPAAVRVHAEAAVPAVAGEASAGRHQLLPTPNDIAGCGCLPTTTTPATTTPNCGCANGTTSVTTPPACDCGDGGSGAPVGVTTSVTTSGTSTPETSTPVTSTSDTAASGVVAVGVHTGGGVGKTGLTTTSLPNTGLSPVLGPLLGLGALMLVAGVLFTFLCRGRATPRAARHSEGTPGHGNTRTDHQY